MKLFKKFTAVILALIMVFSLAGVSASAADTTDVPVLAMKVTSETSSVVKVVISVAKGGFESLDLEFVTSSHIGGCNSIVPTNAFLSVCSDYAGKGITVMPIANAPTKKVALISTAAFNECIELYTAEFTKTSSAKIDKSDITLKITNCTVSSLGGSVNVANKVGVYTSFDTIELASDSLTMNYKTTGNIEYETTLSDSSVTWSSSNEKVVKVDENGTLTAVGRGTATITAGTADGVVVDECKVTVNFSTIQWIIYILLLGFLWY